MPVYSGIPLLEPTYRQGRPLRLYIVPTARLPLRGLDALLGGPPAPPSAPSAPSAFCPGETSPSLKLFSNVAFLWHLTSNGHGDGSLVVVMYAVSVHRMPNLHANALRRKAIGRS